MALSARLRLGASSLLGIAVVTALGYWVTTNWSAQNMAALIGGTSSEETGIFARESNEFRETGRRLHIRALLVDPQALDSRRTVKLVTDMRLSDMLRPGEVLPPQHLERLFIEARAPEVLKERCADWQAVLAERCMLLNATVETNIHSYSGGEAVTVTAHYAVSPKAVDAVEGTPERMEVEHLPIRFDINPNRVSAATRRAMLQRAYDSYLAACADLRAKIGNCNYFGFEFREGRLGNGEFNLSGGASIGALVAPAGKS